MKKNELLNLKLRLEALAMAGVMTVTFASCAKKVEDRELKEYLVSGVDYERIESLMDKIDKTKGYAVEKEVSNDEWSKDNTFVNEVAYLWFFQNLLSEVPRTYKYNYTLNKDILSDEHGNNVLLASINYDYTSHLKVIDREQIIDSDKENPTLQPIRNVYTDRWFNKYKNMVVIPEEYKWIPEEQLFECMETDVITNILKGTDDKYYVCYDIRLTFNDKVKEIEKPNDTYEIPNVKDVITLTSFEKVKEDLTDYVGMASDPIIRYQGGLKADNLEVIASNIGDLNSIRRITLEEVEMYNRSEKAKAEASSHLNEETTIQLKRKRD